MKTIYKSILILLLAVSANHAISADYGINYDDAVEEPRYQLILLPGFERPTKKPLAMHMVDTSDHNNILNLNSSLVTSNNNFETEKYFDDIKITNNNLFEIRF